MKVITVKIPEDTEKRLDSICKETARTKSFFVRKAIEQFLTETAIYQKALDRLNDVSDEMITSEEMSKEI
jgi:RHH-type rel operon transcriptional repressor/antitoxin RelB